MQQNHTLSGEYRFNRTAVNCLPSNRWLFCKIEFAKILAFELASAKSNVIILSSDINRETARSDPLPSGRRYVQFLRSCGLRRHCYHGGSSFCQAQASPGEPWATFTPVGEPTSIPYGWVDFCDRQPQECDQPALAPVDVDLTPGTWSTLNKINREVNLSIEPISNLKHWGTITDHWDYPTDGRAIARSTRYKSAGCPWREVSPVRLC